jgi:cyclase
MLKNRIIASVVIDGDKVVQTEGFEFKHYIHNDAMFAIETFLSWSVDELILMNVSRSQEGYDNFLKIVKKTAEIARLPIAVGGWVNTVSRGEEIIRMGVEKLIINTSFHENPEVPVELSKKLGSQCIVASIDYKIEDQATNVWKNRGMTETNSNLFEWARSVVNLGAGEIYVTNIDNDGRRQGYDIQNLKKLVNEVEVPVVVFGGAMDWEHFAEGLNAGASGVSGANIFHYKELASLKLRKYLLENGYNVRELS